MPFSSQVCLNSGGGGFFHGDEGVEAFPEYCFMGCRWITLSLEAQGAVSVGKGRKPLSGGSCPDLRICIWFLLPLLQGEFFLLSWVRVASCPCAPPDQLPLTRQSRVTCSALEGSYWKRKPYFSGRRATKESFRRLNKAHSRLVSLTAKYCGETNTPNLSCLQFQVRQLELEEQN